MFVITPGGSFSNLVSFAQTNGSKPCGPLIQAGDGSFYGTTSEGGASNNGTIFAVTPAGSLTNLFSFGTTNGSRPLGGLLALSSNLTFYGTCSSGDAFNAGNVFKLQLLSNGVVFSSLYAFTGTSDGASPQAGLVADSSGNLYGTTAAGGTNNLSGGGYGTVFRITTSGSLKTLASFGRTNGSLPSSPLLIGGDGNYYGTTRTGGVTNRGTVFSVGTNGAITTLYSFLGGNDGSDPSYSGLVQTTNGSFYGTASAGGRGSGGTFFRLSGFAPSFLSQPSDQTVPAGTTVGFSVVAEGSTPLTYQWLKNSNNLTDGGRISGSASSTLTITSVTTADSGTYQVVVKNSAGSATNSGAVLTVINPFGISAPLVTIRSPANGSTVLKELVKVVVGVKSATFVGRVYVQLNGGGWQSATPSSGLSKWTAAVTLSPGANVIQAYGVIIAGTASSTNVAVVTCGKDGFVPVTVRITGNGTVSPNYNLVWLQVGRAYRMTAVAQSSNWFANWSTTLATNTPVVTNNPTLAFTAQTNLVLQANFIPNPFVPVSGVYSGLFSDTNNGVTPSSAGFVTFTLSSRGTFSGYLLTPAARYSMSGKFDSNGLAQPVAGHGSATLPLLLQVDMTNGTDQVSGFVSNQTWLAELAGDRSVFNGRTTNSPQSGQYALLFPGTNNPAFGPGGDGFGTLTVDKAGRLRFAGSLADSTKISQAVPISKDGSWPLYAGLYSKQGLLLGWLSLSNGQPALLGNASWVKPASPSTKYYNAGFTNAFGVLGSTYLPPDSAGHILTLASNLMVFSGASLPEIITSHIFLGDNDRVSVSSGAKLSMAFTRSSGVFRGSLVDSGGPSSLPFSGVALQNEALARGYFLQDGQSGQVMAK